MHERADGVQGRAPGPMPLTGNGGTRASEAELDRLLAFAAELARGAGAVLRDLFGTDIEVRHKGAIDLVTEADCRAEAFILGELRERYADHDVLAEESGLTANRSPYLWVVDPLDGTVNFAHAFPYFSTSIALEEAGELAVGVVYNPVLDELFAARRGGPATLNGRPIRVSGVPRLADALLGTGFSYDVHRSLSNVDEFAAFLKLAQSVRRPGSACLDLCSVAAGRFDGLWHPRLAPWDLAAGALIVRQAGGSLSDYRGDPFHLGTSAVVASNGLIHNAMLAVLNRRTDHDPSR